MATVITRWNDAAIEAVRQLAPGPTIASRAYGILNTAMYDAWAAYDPTAVSTQLGDGLQRPTIDNTEANKTIAISYAAYRVLADLFPTKTSLFSNLLTSLGLDPNNTSLDPQTAIGIGNLTAKALLAVRHSDGANQMGNYADNTGYQPINTATNLVDVSRWQPLTVNGRTQQYLTPQWGNVAPFGMTSGSEFRPTTPPAIYGSPAFLQQAQEVLTISANLTDQQKAIAEYWEDGGGTGFPPGHWVNIGKFISQRDNHTLDQDARLFLALGNAVMDAGIAAWATKRYYDSVRPVTAIRTLFKGQQVSAWGGAGKGTQVIDGSNWQPYQSPNAITPPFPEYVSGHSTFSMAAATVLQQFTGSDAYGDSVTVPSLKYDTAAAPMTLKWATFTEAAQEAGLSRLYGGIHFSDGNLIGQALGQKVGQAVWQKAQAYLQAGAASTQLTRTNSNIFSLQGSGLPVALKATFTGIKTGTIDQVGVLAVDDALCRVDGLSPNDPGYVAAALRRSQTVFSALPDAFLNGVSLTRQITLPTNQPLMFYLIKGNTAEGVLADLEVGKPLDPVFFSFNSANPGQIDCLKVIDQGNGVFDLAWTDQPENNQSFDSLKLRVQVGSSVSLDQWTARAQDSANVIDLSLRDSLVPTNFTVNHEAAYANTFGFYKIADLTGGIDTNGDGKIDVRPGEANYAAEAIRNAVFVRSADAPSGPGNLTGGGLLAPFLIANSTQEAFLAQNASNTPGKGPLAYFAFLGANPDRRDHIRLLADNVFGFEDLYQTGDQDFNDLVVQVKFPTV